MSRKYPHNIVGSKLDLEFTIHLEMPDGACKTLKYSKLYKKVFILSVVNEDDELLWHMASIGDTKKYWKFRTVLENLKF